jgi:hypothetical protein
MPVRSVATAGWTQTGQITSLTIPTSVTSFGADLSGDNILNVTFASNSPITTLPSNVFNNMPLTSLTLPDHLEFLPNLAFSGTSSLTSIVLPNTITHIGYAPFYGAGLTTVNFPTSLVTIDQYAFGNSNLNLGAITLPAGVTTIGPGAFKSAHITSVTLNSAVTSIGNQAFEDNQLTSLTLPASLQTIDDNAFRTNSLTSLTIPATVTSIGNYAFAYNNFTSTPTVPAGTTVGTGVFASSGTSSGWLWSSLDGSSATITGCDATCSTLPSVTIPSTIAGMPVRSVATAGWTQTENGRAHD